MSAVLFFLAALGAIIGALGVVLLRNPFYAVLSLVSHLIALAALFLLLRAEFVAAAQVVVYAGAVMVLYVFVVAYVGGGENEVLGGTPMRIIGPICAALLAIELSIAMIGAGLKGVNTKGAHYNPGTGPAHPGFGSPNQIGQLFLTKYLFPFEAASLILLVAAIGALVLARRRRGLTAVEDAEIFLHAPRPRNTGTMAEGGGIREALRAIEEAGLGPVETRHREGVDEGAPLAGRSSSHEEGGW